MGIGNTAPTAKLDVSGGATVRGLLYLPATGTATSTAGKNSQAQEFVASSNFQPSANGKHSSTAQTVQPAVALVWKVANFEKLLDRFPAFRRNTVTALEERLREMEQRFREVSTLNVGPRLSSELIRLSNRFGCGDNGLREIHLSREELAELTGTTLSTVSRLLCRWQKLGIVSIRREVVLVCDFGALTQLTLKRLIE